MFEIVAKNTPKLRICAGAMLTGLALALMAPPARAQSSALPADLDLIPRDAVGFFHFRAKDIWQSDWMKDVRYLIDKAGPEAWKEFERRSPLTPSTIDRITLV